MLKFVNKLFCVLSILVVAIFSNSCTSINKKRTVSSEAASADISYAQKLAFFYSDGSYRYLNQILRNSIRFSDEGVEVFPFDAQDSQLKEDLKGHDVQTTPIEYHEVIVRYRYHLEKALQTLGLTKWANLYRGTPLLEVMSQYKAGDIIREPSFLSTSQSQAGAEKFLNIAKQSGKNDVALWIFHDAIGASLAGHSFSPDETEVLLPPWSILRINKVIPGQMGTPWVFDVSIVLEDALTKAEKLELQKRDHLRQQHIIQTWYDNDMDKLSAARQQAEKKLKDINHFWAPIDYSFLRY